jgi:hypothetical protein
MTRRRTGPMDFPGLQSAALAAPPLFASSLQALCQ